MPTEKIESIAQTNSASQIEEYKKEILKSLIEYKKRLDLRNPNAYNKQIQSSLEHQVMINKDYINLLKDGKRLNSSDEYFYYAFSKQNIKNRNDFLIIGLYKLIFKAYSMDSEHQFTAMEYSKYELQKLYEYLQVVRWKIRVDKNDKGEYLFNTWQNNWQLELAKKYSSDYNIINNLEYIKSNKESVYDHSNFSFEIILSKMIIDVEHTLRKINVEPYEMSISALTGFIFIL
ncbi:MAG: hypothetical protein PHG81_08495 [Aliarcobacter sp.]|nr:hypothetical protein [Aliarcobacter sp.]